MAGDLRDDRGVRADRRRKSTPRGSSPRAYSLAIFALVPVPHGERSIPPVREAGRSQLAGPHDIVTALRRSPSPSGAPDSCAIVTPGTVRVLDIVRTPCAVVAAGSSAKSMHVFARMQDVDLDGRANPISSWQAVVHGPHPDRFVQVDLSPISYRVRPGHRLRLQLASSDFPYYLFHPGTDENPWFASEYVANEQRLVTGGDMGSYVEVPVLLGDATNAV